MLVSRIAARSSRTVLTQCRNSLLLLARLKQPFVPALSNQYHSHIASWNRVVAGQVSLLRCNGTPFQQFGMSSSASPHHNEKDSGSALEGDAAAAPKSSAEKASSEARVENEKEAKVKGEKDVSDSEDDLSRDDLVKLVVEKEEQLKIKHEELQKMQDKALRAYAEMQNSMDRTKRDAENMKKFALQDFAKSLLDVADNLGRASSAVKDNFLKIDASKDTVGAVPLLKTLLQGVEMTDKQLAEVLIKYGVQKYDPVDEEFDPHRHNAVFQVPDPSKPPGTVAVVLKAGYMLHDRIIRPAEVGVTRAVENEADQGSETTNA